MLSPSHLRPIAEYNDQCRAIRPAHQINLFRLHNDSCGITSTTAEVEVHPKRLLVNDWHNTEASPFFEGVPEIEISYRKGYCLHYKHSTGIPAEVGAWNEPTIYGEFRPSGTLLFSKIIVHHSHCAIRNEMVDVTVAAKRIIGKHFVVGFHGTAVNPEITSLIQEYHVQNIILMKRNIKDAKQAKELVQSLQRLALAAGHEMPLLVGIDQENGLVSAFSSPTAGTQFPGAMALASVGDVKAAERVAAASAAELKLAGINWVYSPVADVNTDSKNPVIGVRSFGDDPADVAKFAVAVSRGHASSGIASTAKHFPGHGDTHVDSHLALPVISKAKSQLDHDELVPFRALITAEIPSIMTGHMALPLVTGSDEPCSLSKVATTRMLRGELGYKGVIVTDCLEMDAISEPERGGCGTEEGALRAIQAGADVVMICHTFERQKGALETLYRALSEGRVDYDLLKASGGRIDAMRRNFAGSWAACLSSEQGWEEKFQRVKAEGQKLSREIYTRTAKIIWNSAQVLPLEPIGFSDDKKLLVLTPETEAVNRAVDSDDGTVVDANGVVRNTAGPSYVAFALVLEERVKGSRHVVYGRQTPARTVVSSDVGGVVFVLRNANLRRWQLDFLDALELRNLGIPVVLVSSCGPYDLQGVEEKYQDWTGYICTYEFTAEGLIGGISRILSE